MPQTNTPIQPTKKHSDEDLRSRIIHYAVIGMAVILFIILNVYFINNARPASLNFRFNIFAILSMAAIISNLVAFGLITRIKERTYILMWFSIFLLSLTAWAGAEFLVRLSATPVTVIFWNHFTVIGTVFFPVALYMFSLAYTGSKRVLSPFVFSLLAAVSALFILIDGKTNLVLNYNVAAVKTTSWGYVVPTGPLYKAIVLWVILLSLLSLMMLFRFRRRTIEPTLRFQTRLFMIAIFVPLLGGSITDGLLPSLNKAVVPTMAVMLLTITGLIISYGILKHHFFRFTPSLVADQILNTMSEAVIGLTPQLRLSYANPGAVQMLELSVKELLNKSLSDILADKWTSEQLNQKIFDHLRDQDSYTIDSVNIRSSSTAVITTKFSISKINTGDDPSGYLIVLTDITDLAQNQTLIELKVNERTHQLNEEHIRLESAINSLDVGLLMTFRDNNSISYNAMLEHMFGIYHTAKDTDELRVKLTLSMIEDKLMASKFNLAKAIDICQHTGQYFNISEVTFANRILSIFGAPIRDKDNDVVGTVILFSDVTEAKILERSKDEFFSIASHELRTPLTGIRGNSSMILDYYKDLLTDHQLKEMIEDIHISSIRLIKIVNDFLDLSRLEQGKIRFNYSPISIDKVIESVAYEMRAVLDEKQIYLKLDKLTLGILPPVWADENRLKQVVYNLVGNAAKYTEHGGITINAKLSDGKDYISVIVSDSGRGMSPESQQLLFHKFQQASNSLLTRDTTRGTGLGLYISRMIIENMGGRIMLEHSEPNVGSSFSFIIPVATKKQQLTHPPVPSS